tara:strand:+ start:328 stop:726 length:399 start_codon:yes stop_codon:yes gene_type:complete
MAHFAKLGTGNIVERVEVVHNDIATTEQAGVEFLQNLYQDRSVWKQTSYNTLAGEHLLGGTPLRKNYAGIGFKYDQIRDAFIPPKRYNSWTLNEDTCQWEAPIPMPELTQEQIDNNNFYEWNEENQTWDLNE